MQAAFLEQGIVGELAALLRQLVFRNDSAAEVTALCTMALEVVTVLFNPDVCLNPMPPASQRVLDECPSLEEVASPQESPRQPFRSRANHSLVSQMPADLS